MQFFQCQPVKTSRIISTNALGIGNGNDNICISKDTGSANSNDNIHGNRNRNGYINIMLISVVIRM